MDHIHDLMVRTRVALGFDGYAYSGIRPTVTLHLTPILTNADTIALTDVDPGWLAHYAERAYFTTDPVFRAALGQSVPVLWGLDFLNGTMSGDEAAMFRDGNAWGIRSGICVVTRAGDGTLGMLAMTASTPEAPDRPDLAEEFQLIAIHLHEVMRRHIRWPAVDAKRLTPRELDVIMWSAQGKTAGEVATILGVTPRTVNAHLTSAMRKLDVTSKTHAVAKYLTSLV